MNILPFEKKVYGINEVEERRYSPPKCIAVETRVISGSPDPDHICTSYVERQNLTVRMQSGDVLLLRPSSTEIVDHMGFVRRSTMEVRHA